MKDPDKIPTRKLPTRKKRRRVRISPKSQNQVFFADSYDRTPPEIDVFNCDICQKYILQERYHCNICEDYDLCKGCATGEDKKHEHDDFEVILPPSEEEDDEPAVSSRSR